MLGVGAGDRPPTPTRAGGPGDPGSGRFAEKGAGQPQGAGCGRRWPRKGLPARPGPPRAERLFPPARRRQSRPGREPRQVRPGLSPPSSPRPEKGFLPTRARSRRDSEILTLQRWKDQRGTGGQRQGETERQRYRDRESETESERDRDGERHRDKDRDTQRDRDSERDTPERYTRIDTDISPHLGRNTGSEIERQKERETQRRRDRAPHRPARALCSLLPSPPNQPLAGKAAGAGAGASPGQ